VPTCAIANPVLTAIVEVLTNQHRSERDGDGLAYGHGAEHRERRPLPYEPLRVDEHPDRDENPVSDRTCIVIPFAWRQCLRGQACRRAGRQTGRLPRRDARLAADPEQCAQASWPASPYARQADRGHPMSAPAASWCDPVGGSPARVRGSVLLGSDHCDGHPAPCARGTLRLRLRAFPAWQK